MTNKNTTEKGTISWKCPSNIALVKYWGKHGTQLPSNPSLSFTLSKAFTETTLTFEAKDQTGLSLDYFFEGRKNKAFGDRITQYINNVIEKLPSLKGLHMHIHSRNSFPHSSGIASSASAFGAMALILNDIYYHLTAKSEKDSAFMREASELARLGSGSASRSLYPGFALWGKTEACRDSSDRYAVPLDENDIHEEFRSLKDSILIVSKGEKDVKSSAGHALMKKHPYAKARFEQARKNLQSMLRAIRSGDMEQFIGIAENEAMSLHAMMMTSSPSYLLLKPNSLMIIEKIRRFRKQNKLPVCFTIDAGPNIHVIYSERVESKVKDFIKDDLLVYCEAEKWIDDGMGEGPEKLK